MCKPRIKKRLSRLNTENLENVTCTSRLLMFDMFRERYYMSLDEEGLNSQASLTGSCFSIAVTLILLLYLSYDVVNVIEKNGWKMISTVRENYFQEKDIFG